MRWFLVSLGRWYWTLDWGSLAFVGICSSGVYWYCFVWVSMAWSILMSSGWSWRKILRAMSMDDMVDKNRWMWGFKEFLMCLSACLGLYRGGDSRKLLWFFFSQNEKKEKFLVFIINCAEGL